MFKELFELWAAKVEAVRKIDIVPFDRFKDRLVVEASGDFKIVNADAPDRNHQAGSIEALAEFLRQYEDAPPPLVWYSREAVTAVIDNNTDRRNKIGFTLSLSPAMGALVQMEQNHKQRSQKEVLSLLRITFRDAGLGNLAEMFRKVKFTVNEAGETQLAKDKSSVGRSVLAEFHGLTNLPEEIAFNVPVFASKFDCREPVMVAIEPDPSTQTFQLIPFPGQIEAALQRAEVKLGKALADAMPDGVPVLFGKP